MMKRDAFHTLFAKFLLASTRSIVETHIITRSISGDQCQTQGICTVLVNDFQRIDTVS